MLVTLVLLVALLAFANGANDNGKGVATLVGYGAARPFTALAYATAATALGGAFSFFLAPALFKAFSGTFLFHGGVTLDRPFYVAVLVGACGWVLLANVTSMPVSTTHAIIGALCGAGFVAFGGAHFEWHVLGKKFAMPLAVSPVLSLAIVYVLAWPVLWAVGRWAGRCVCVVECEPAAVPVGAAATGGAVVASDASSYATLGPRLSIVAGHESECAAGDAGQPVAAVSASATANTLHWLSGGLTSFARGWNDTPKIAGLSVLALSGAAHGTAIGFAVVTLAMAAGGLLMGRKVLQTLARKLTPLPLTESLTASLVTATLVGLASWNGLPVSTTHVATGSIIGAGLKNDPRGVRWGKVGEIVLSWVITLPVAAAIAAAAKWLIH